MHFNAPPWSRVVSVSWMTLAGVVMLGAFSEPAPPEERNDP